MNQIVEDGEYSRNLGPYVYDEEGASQIYDVIFVDADSEKSCWSYCHEELFIDVDENDDIDCEGHRHWDAEKGQWVDVGLDEVKDFCGFRFQDQYGNNLCESYEYTNPAAKEKGGDWFGTVSRDKETKDD